METREIHPEEFKRLPHNNFHKPLFGFLGNNSRRGGEVKMGGSKEERKEHKKLKGFATDRRQCLWT